MQELLYKQDKTKDDINSLLMQHKNLVYHMLKTTGQLDNQEAESHAWEALWDAIGTFDIYSTTKFSTYACSVIRNAIYDVINYQRGFASRQAAVAEYMEKHTDEINEYINVESELDNKIGTLVKTFVESKQGVIKNVVIFWYSNNFDVSVKSIATACKCSPSYVSRVQDSFRAYLSGHLKEID